MNLLLFVGWPAQSSYSPATACLPTFLFPALISTVSFIISTPQALFARSALKISPPTANVFAEQGDRLPYSSPFSTNLSLDQRFPLGGSGFIGGGVSYVGNRKSDFASSALVPRRTFPDYTDTDPRAGVTTGSRNGNLFANNVTEKRRVLSGSVVSNSLSLVRPRTIGAFRYEND